MDKRAALDEVRRRKGVTLEPRDVRFANVNRSKPVWWLDIPLDEISDPVRPDLHLLLADPSGEVHHLRVPKEWMMENLASFAIREDKRVLSLELSCVSRNRFQDVRPTSGRLGFSKFVR